MFDKVDKFFTHLEFALFGILIGLVVGWCIYESSPFDRGEFAENVRYVCNKDWTSCICYKKFSDEFFDCPVKAK